MAYPIGKAPLADGTGTTPTEFQRWLGAQFHTSGIIPTEHGRVTVTGTSSMAYRVSAGAVVLIDGNGLGLGFGIEAQTLPTAAAPATGSRTDRIVMDRAGRVSVTQGAAPAGGITLASFTVPAGVTSTAAAAQSFDRNFAIPAGGSLDRLAFWQDPGGGAATTTRKARHVSRFFLPSERLFEITLTTTIKSTTATAGSMAFDVTLTNRSGTWTRRMWVPHTPVWETRSAVWSGGATEGENTLTVYTQGISGGAWEFSHSQSVTELAMWDRGPNE